MITSEDFLLPSPQVCRVGVLCSLVPLYKFISSLIGPKPQKSGNFIIFRVFFRVLYIKKMNVSNHVPPTFNVIPVGSSFFMNSTREVRTNFSQTIREN